ncbi:MAG: hypothetical protein R3A78_00480 [Polyangiales bacterium]|nr:hypothetical protein [Myxococcales bacterium]
MGATTRGVEGVRPRWRDGALCLLVASAISACGAGPKTEAESALDAVQSAAALRARAEAPDLVALAALAADRARASEATGDAVAAAEYATRARTLVEVAVAATDLAVLERERRRYETDASKTLVDVAAVEATLRAETERVQRDAAAALAGDEASRAFELATADERARFRESSAERRAAFAKATGTLLDRARLMLAAAAAMGAAATEVDALTLRIADARNAKPESTALELADVIVRDVLALLGTLRARAPAATLAERASLEEEARAFGFTLEAKPEGLLVGVARPGTVADKRLGALIAAHPHGAAVLLGPKAERARVRAAAQAAGVESGRMADADGQALGVLFAAYAK